MPTLTAPIVNTTFEGILMPENCKSVEKSLAPEKTTFWGALLASAERRRSADAGRHASSPLSTMTEEAKGEQEQEGETLALNRDADGDVIMETVDPAVFEKPSSPFPPNVPNISSPVDSLMGLISKRRHRRDRPPACLESQSNKDQAYSVLVVATPPPPVVLKSEEKVGLTVPSVLLEKLEPLSKARSRGG